MQPGAIKGILGNGPRFWRDSCMKIGNSGVCESFDRNGADGKELGKGGPF